MLFIFRIFYGFISIRKDDKSLPGSDLDLSTVKIADKFSFHFIIGTDFLVNGN